MMSSVHRRVCQMLLMKLVSRKHITPVFTPVCVSLSLWTWNLSRASRNSATHTQRWWWWWWLNHEIKRWLRLWCSTTLGFLQQQRWKIKCYFWSSVWLGGRNSSAPPQPRHGGEEPAVRSQFIFLWCCNKQGYNLHTRIRARDAGTNGKLII